MPNTTQTAARSCADALRSLADRIERIGEEGPRSLEHARQNTASVFASRPVESPQQAQSVDVQKITFFQQDGGKEAIDMIVFGRLDRYYDSLIGAEFESVIHKIADRNIKAQIWNCANDRYKSISAMYCRGADGIVLSPDLSRSPANEVTSWLDGMLNVDCAEHIRLSGCPVFIIPHHRIRGDVLARKQTGVDESLSALRTYVDTRRENGISIQLLECAHPGNLQAAKEMFNGIIETLDERKQAAAQSAAEEPATRREEPGILQRLWACCTFQSCLSRRREERGTAAAPLLGE
ncbi:MAG: hypothetical protein K0R66_493 [Gammaproteobacteria bacterium]|jgi:hypothetical protein|nr:hypothetical protein [Gammaproteobacteria bacterium]